MKKLQKLGQKNSFKLINLIKSGVENIKDINKKSKIILPRIGSFNYFIKSLKKNQLFDKIYELVVFKKILIFGICVGMQSLFK